MASTDSLLFTPLKLGKVELSHRVVLSALTRLRADKNHVATDLMKEYYLQRTSIPGGLIIAESASIAKHHGGMSYTSAIWGEEHIQGWKPIVDAVHNKGSFMYLQLMAFGRAAQRSAAEEDGFKIKAPSAILFEGSETPEEMTVEDIKSTVQDYVQAAKNAMRAGFDGVELYAANGYLLDQFIQDVSNQRTDEYGGSIENRNRLIIEVAQAVADTIGAERVGIKLSPWSDFQGMRMENPIPQFTDLIRRLNNIGIGYLNLIESRVSGIDYTDGTEELGHGQSGTGPSLRQEAICLRRHWNWLTSTRTGILLSPLEGDTCRTLTCHSVSREVLSSARMIAVHSTKWALLMDSLTIHLARSIWRCRKTDDG
ncbi:hypothetical protein J3F84DRAFT_386937 [Trichoderma pleuroticola]